MSGFQKDDDDESSRDLPTNNNQDINNNNNNNNNKKKKKVRYQDEEKKSLAANYSDDDEYNSDQEEYEPISLQKGADGEEEEEQEDGIILQPIVRDPSTYRPQSLYNSNDEIREGDSFSAKISKTIGKTNKKLKEKIGESNKKIEQRVKTSNKAIEGKLQEGWDTIAGVAMKPVENIREQHHRRVEKHEVEERAGWFKDKLNIQKYECLDYVTIYNKAYRLELYKNFNKLVSDNEWLRWIVSLFMGISIGIIAYISHAAVSNITKYKFKYVEKILELDMFLGFLAYFLVNSLLATLSSLLAVYYEPTAAGSGIPEVKGYLNGTKIPHTLKMKTLWTKLTSMILAVSSGLQVGSEGPMIHIGAIVGNGFSQAQSKEFGFKIPFLRSFRNDKDKRDFVTSGAGAGVAAAFGAPLGGALFSMEEVASFWSTTLTWRCFFSCLVATFVMNLLQSNSGDISGLIIFNTGKNIDKEFSYHLFELIPFIIIGVLGGFAGALFTFINVKVTEFRREKINKVKSLRVLEVFLIIGVSTFLQFFVPLLFSCRVKPDLKELAESLEELKQFNCPEGHYNPMASIMFAPYEQSIFNLFTFNESKEFDYVHMFGLPALFIFFAFYLLFAAYTAGSGISSGTFVPMIVIGAAYGRAVGVIMSYIIPNSTIDPGVYAIMGAAAFMGGVSRLTVSLTVILIEITNQLQYLLPIMLTVMTAKWVADALIHPLFDILIQMKYIPYLEPHPSKEMKLMMCKHIMAKKPVYLCETSTIGEILRVLKETRHNGFPVVNNHDDRLVKGLLLRTQLLMILERVSDVYIPNSETVYSHLEYTTKLTWKLPSVNDFSFDPADYDQEVDLTEVMNITVINVNVEFAVSEAFHLFRTMGLRHMPVVNDNNKLKGIITKKDLLEKTCEQRYRELSHMKLGIEQLLHVGDDN
ncbi:hypothetical protein DICPUDRAFT_150047 [Dictyostelium purpureum]|uniref:Chloride channel protein n=1 Tax=Dictyostelium purpureum TaxID=5786 RepID=F0ZFB6_DICPU|nr:uncharacterized protein DICPUDRAFT_150047 [Dictyostelium purpureum]EGC37379.1 hypothetical protein DICPUDRAFT_150047 [Dictyostelium purpureum]|eukprot:XP_003286120.1 hypothetical protein DICPUDRAFT_150047 [Dictyostelium purpureum]